MLPREEMFQRRGCHSFLLYLGFHNRFYSNRVKGNFFPLPQLQIKKQEGGCGKETTVTEITSILGQRDSRRKMDGGEASQTCTSSLDRVSHYLSCS